MTSPRDNLPWLSKSLLASIREKASLYSRAKRTNKADLWAKYKLCKRQTQRAIRSARWSFLKNKLSESLEQKNSKPHWRYIKSKRQDGNGVSPLKENGQLHSDSRRKAEILNNQFCSVFTSEDTTNIPKITGPPHHILVFALVRPWNGRPTLTKLQVKQIPLWASFGGT